MSEAPHDTGTGLAGEFSRLRTNGSASAEEIREFVAGLRGRTPQEMLGVVAESGLFRSMLVATIGCFVLIAGLTVGPYLWAKASGPGEPEQAAKAAAPAEQDDANDADGTVAPRSTDDVADAADTGGADPERAVDALGIGETKEAPADTNPRDAELDNLLDGLE